jgi:hypothetical protein
MIARHTNRIFKPASAGAGESREYSRTNGNQNQPGPMLLKKRSPNSTSTIMPWGVDESTLRLYEVPFDGQQLSDGDTALEKASNTKKKETEKPELTKIRTKYKCVESILRKAVIEPYYIDSQVIGLEINGLEEMSQGETTILKSGDIIISVNGQHLGSKKEAYKIFIGARKEPIMIVDLLQDGQPKKLLLDFQ